jgi:hypothetical protein
VCLAALVVSTAALLPAAPKLTFSLGVLRRDGILIPFASFNGHDWSTPWPTSDTGVSLPIGLQDVPKSWWGPTGPAVMVADGSRRPLRLEKPAQVRVFCGGRVGLATDYTGGEPVDPREPTVAKDALAIAGDVTVAPINMISLYTPDAARLVAAMTKEFNAQEKIAATQFTNWVHPYDAAERALVPIELEAFYRTREKTPRHGEWVLSYVEAIRRFPATPHEQGCGLITWVRGWVIERPGQTPDLHLTARVTYCDREGVAFMQPFGEISLDGENYWIYQMSSWRDEIYAIVRVRPDEVRPIVNVFGGGCPKKALTAIPQSSIPE